MTATLTATPRWSLVSPVLVPTDAAAAVLVLTHLVAATIVIPTLAARLR